MKALKRGEESGSYEKAPTSLGNGRRTVFIPALTFSASTGSTFTRTILFNSTSTMVNCGSYRSRTLRPGIPLRFGEHEPGKGEVLFGVLAEEYPRVFEVP